MKKHVRKCKDVRQMSQKTLNYRYTIHHVVVCTVFEISNGIGACALKVRVKLIIHLVGHQTLVWPIGVFSVFCVPCEKSARKAHLASHGGSVRHAHS